uniref:Uncharacterized protein n=1 Tax=Arundo donax TaxID=35708 RepID=A0A0A9B0C3_ARUDO
MCNLSCFTIIFYVMPDCSSLYSGAGNMFFWSLFHSRKKASFLSYVFNFRCYFKFVFMCISSCW